MEDIHEIKPLMNLDFPWLPFLATLSLMIGLILLAAWILLRILRGRKAPESDEAHEENIKEPQTVRDEALAALEKLANSNWIRQEQSKLFYLELEAIFKHFLEGLHLQAVSSFTDQELKDFLKQLPQVSWENSGFETLLNRSLMARFAKGQVSGQAMQNDLENLRKFIQTYAEQTIP
ncbi:hypothetical protein COW36_13430 [bacterium (Candidatus Blackallbacteria) CG17_big_fil_post_rev_8_21_14_2_50_48_46]|uniref:DUF4381 domain-containing protein n=1 Tax=bacterium (Candidatus Blackallbacteria) CG17_big_fil_post_rev_8_21_14_2_50_48_46 TaxID=2014261 RepID=A0A2M7G3B9_9BACT|nr:MAG: hypothetical protein COW64_22050 [bacterium (Candidatus Blackallbacteria) CG18_big_fil_WC_8_21_14_2_50_49_26]PIW16329.1 MAG: hypothetical protein COW36_13430 [bacterium (Candidatus Blackallbacteria) CG17_big_fil_post_rev_8_21_14_2_50_48_46]PIW45343.1 MAG: hypothetical protein COW20_20665 [bacterium (Candidatus Blackallbacteria) CG13_big_fil_rev_8_21_14_2_50_49_14]